jgi:hypothetical protein
MTYMVSRWLSLYLRDHHAASAGGVALARRALGPDHTITRPIARDRKTLEDVMRQLEVPSSASKVALVRIAERVGRLKLNGRLFTPSAQVPRGRMRARAVQPSHQRGIAQLADELEHIENGRIEAIASLAVAVRKVQHELK